MEPFAFQLVGNNVEVRSEFLNLAEQRLPLLFPLFELVSKRIIVLQESQTDQCLVREVLPEYDPPARVYQPPSSPARRSSPR